MKTLKYTVSIIASLLFFGANSAFGGMAMHAPVGWFIAGAHLVAIVEIKNVTVVEVGTSKVYVAEAAVTDALRSDLLPVEPNRKIAIVGSSIPLSSAVWRPIEKGRYLAFLKRSQGHYYYDEKYAMRPINAEGKVEWLRKKAEGGFNVIDLDVDEAIKRVQLMLSRQAATKIGTIDYAEAAKGIDGID